MKKKFRLQTTTPEGKVILSPFVFSQTEVQRRLRRPKLTEKMEREGTKTEAIVVDKYPPKATWKPRFNGKRIDKFLIPRIEEVMEEWESLREH